MRYLAWLALSLSLAAYAMASGTSPQLYRELAKRPVAVPANSDYVLTVMTSAQGKVVSRSTIATIGGGDVTFSRMTSALRNNVITTQGVATTTADGTRYVNPGNTTACPADGPPLSICTLPSGVYWYGTVDSVTGWHEVGSNAAPSPIPMSGLSDWPAGVTATNVGHLAGTTSNIQQQFTALSAQVADLMAAMEAGGIDITPAAFSFTDQTTVDINSTITSAPITVTGINTATAISVTGGSYDINASGNFVTTNGTVSNNDTVRARHTSSASNSEATNTTITIGGVSDTFTSTTAPVQSCSEVFASATPTTDSVGIKTDANRVYQGMIITGSTTSPICSITVRVHGMAGNRTTYNYRAYLYSRNGTALNLDTGLKATSNPVVGSTMTTGNEVTFTFPTPIVPATGDVFVFSHDQAVSSANYILLSRGTADTDSGFAQQASYLADGTQFTTAASYELYYKLVR